jgi:hypothetical protein
LVLLGVIADVAGFVGACEEAELGRESESVVEGGNVQKKTEVGSDGMLVGTVVGEDLGQVVQRRAIAAMPKTTDTQSGLDDELDEKAGTPMSDDEMSNDSFNGFSSPPHMLTEYTGPAPPLMYQEQAEAEGETHELMGENIEAQEEVTSGTLPPAEEDDATRTTTTALSAKNESRKVTKRSATTRPAQSDAGNSGKQTIKKTPKKKEKKRNAIDDLFAGLA